MFVRAIERIDRLHNRDDAGGFLRGIARHVVQEHFRARRKDRRYEQVTAEAMSVDVETVEAICHDRGMIRLLGQAIAELPVVSRRMLEMRYHDDLSASEIAAKLGIEHGAVRVSLLRIRERLRKAVDQMHQQRRQF